MSAQDQGQKYKFYKILAWALLGAVLTFIASTVALTGNHTFNGPFYNIGEVAEIRINPFRVDIQQEKGYQEASGTVVMEQGEFYYTYTLSSYSDAWNYFCVRIDELSTDSLVLKVIYQELENETVVESIGETYSLKEGMNALSLPEQKFDQMQLCFYGEDGSSFKIGKIQFRENLPIFDYTGVVLTAVLTILCYLILSWIIRVIYKRIGGKGCIRPYIVIDILQEMYLVIANRLAVFQSKFHIRSKRRRTLRTIFFLGMCCYVMWVTIAGNYYEFFRFHSLVYVLILSAVAVLCIEEKPKKKNWNNPLVWGWFILAFMMCISDFVVPKDTGTNYQFFGFALILFIGFFIFAWNNMKDRGEIIEDFVRAIHIFFWIAAVYCVLFRPDDGETRYAGFTANPNGWGKYMAAFWAIVLGSLDYAIRTQKEKREIFLYIVEGCLVFSFAWKTQSVTSLIAIFLVAIFWLVRMIVYAFRNKKKRAVMGMLICAIVLFLPLHCVLSIGLLHVPEKLGTAVVCEDDILIERAQINTVVYAADTSSSFSDNRLIQKLTSTSMDSALSGRPYIYREYFRELNLFGHETRPVVYGVETRPYPHNEILGKAYNYGIFAAIPYVVMLTAALVRTWRFSRKKVKYAAVPFFACLSFVVISMADVADAPFHRLLWDCMYLLMGCVFCDDDLVEEGSDLIRKRERLETFENKEQQNDI